MDNRRTNEPTSKQAGVLGYIIGFTALKGFAPTEREIAEAFGVCRTAVTGHVRRLIKKGFLHRRVDGKASRNLVVTL